MSTDNRLGSLRNILDTPPRTRRTTDTDSRPNRDTSESQTEGPAQAQGPGETGHGVGQSGADDNAAPEISRPSSISVDAPAPDADVPAGAPRPRHGRPGEQRGPAPEPARKPTSRTSAPRRINATSATRARVVLRMPEHVHRFMVDAARQDQLTHAAVVLQAVEHTYVDGRLAERLTELRRAEQPVRTGLFTTQPARATPEPKVLVELRLRHEDLEVLDGLITEVGANDRSELINTSLALYLA
ncbi:hypothetical protein [Nocardioides sp. ChNu-99]|uniref:hypothetical protein n=1 Tax=Nocardioides sp. ChNu-99 TaxID=2839897 RepID=UPI002405EFAD|nr:hypothetical protein [Nocardioides sp. ChNu-99]MDF9716456.1 hypothetical protein [Nocardioides sp. ChNu-99]